MRARRAHKGFRTRLLLPIGIAVEESPGRLEAESAAERRLHAVVDTLGLHVYSGQTYPDDHFVTLVSLTPARSLLGLPADAQGGDETWIAAIHPDDRERYDEVFCYANECLLHPLELEYRLCGYDGVERWVWERIFPHRLRPDGAVDIDGVVADVTALHDATKERNELAQRLERVLGGVAEFVVSCELRDGRTIWTNPGPGAERMLGGPLPEGADGPTVWYECVHPDDRPALDAYLERLGQREPAEATYRLRGLDGVERWVWARARPHPGAGPVAYDAVISDVTERERARIGLQLAREEAERRSRVDPTTGLFNRHHLLDVARRELARSQRENTSPALVLLDVDRLRELNERRGHAVGDSVLRELAGRLSHSVRTYDTISHFGGGRFAVLVPDLRDGEALRRICDEICTTLTQEPLRSAGRELHVTVSAGGARSHPGTTVDALLHTAEVALATAKRSGPGRQDVKDSRLDPCEDETGEAALVAATLARAAAVREGVPHEHECSVAELAELVGRELGLPESLQGDLRLAGLLHDVGTIAVAGAVLSKPGPLDEDEWVLLREHPSIGADMVARIPGLARTQLAIRHHHERFDGQGYPDRLAGESIPMTARVLAAVDAYNAMTEIRPYRNARDREEALEELRRNAGTQLDPTVVDALCRVLDGESAGALAA
jgi:diguanylate cyclase (GGDEF)-like protein/PAS domain S-box-containing protein